MANFPDVQISLNLLSLFQKTLSVERIKLISPSFYLTPFEGWLKQAPSLSSESKVILSQKKGGSSAQYFKVDFNTIEILKGEVIRELIHLKNINLKTEAFKDSSFLLTGKVNYENYTATLKGESSYPALLEKLFLKVKIRKEKQEVGSTYLSLNKEKGNTYTGKIKGIIKNIDLPFIEKNGKFSASFNYGENLLTLNTFHSTFGKFDVTGKGKGTLNYFKISLQGNYLPLKISAHIESKDKKGKLHLGVSHVNEFSRENNLPLIGDTVTVFLPFHLQKDHLTFSHYSLLSDHVACEGSLDYKTSENTSFFQGNIHFPKFSVVLPEDSSLPQLPASPSPFLKKTDKEDGCKKPYSFSYLNNLKGTLNLSIQNFSYGKIFFIDSINTALEIDKGSARIKDLLLKGYKGTIKINGTLNAQGFLNAAYAINHLQLEEVPFIKEKASLVKKAPLNGKGNFTADISFPPEIVKTLKGKGAFFGNNWMIESINPRDIRDQLKSLAEFKTFKNFKPTDLLVKKVNSLFSLEDNKVTIDDFTAKSEEIQVSGKGNINLRDKTIDFTTQTETGFFKNPFLIHFYGPFSSPKWTLDTKELIKTFVEEMGGKVIEKVGKGIKNSLGAFLFSKRN